MVNGKIFILTNGIKIIITIVLKHQDKTVTHF